MGAHEITKIVESQFVGRQLRVKKHPTLRYVCVSGQKDCGKTRVCFLDFV